MKAGWEVRSLADVANIVNGGTPKSKVADYWGGGIKWLTPKDMGQMQGREIDDTPRTISEEGLQRCSARLVPEHSVILSTRAPIGHLAVNTVPMAFNQGCRGLVPKGSLDHVYLYYFLAANRDALNELGTGTTFKELSAGNLKSVSIPLPPLDEQKRIVAILDEAFEGLDRARANAEANLQNARELFDASVDFLLTKDRDIWRSGKLSELVGPVSTGPFGSLLHKADYVEGGIPLVNPANIVDGKIQPDQRKTIDGRALRRLSSYVLRSSDIVIGRRGEMGRCATVSDDQAGWICGTGSFFIRPKEGIASGFVAHVLRSPSYVKKLEAASTGTTMANLSNKALSNLIISLPKANRQTQYLEVIDDLEQTSNSAVSSYMATIQDLDELRQSLLQKAFAGELT